MRSRLRFLVLLLLIVLSTFLVGKVAFMLYNSSISPFGCRDVVDVLWHGLSMDLSTTNYILVLPWLLCLAAVWWAELPLRRFLIPYYIIMGVLLGVIIGGDAFLYEFWKFKLNAAIFSYMQNIEGTVNSVSLWFIVSRLMVVLMGVIAFVWACIRLTPQRMETSCHRVLCTLGMVLTGGVMFVMIRGGVQESTMNVGTAYYSQHLFLNHSAVNPAFSLLSSVNSSKDFSKQFDYLQETELSQTFDGLYPAPADDITDTLLSVRRPNVLIVLMESFGAKFVEELGGIPGVSPNMSRLIKEGVFWRNYYANSFRTDRGTVCAYSGFVSYPTTSLMKLNDHNQNLPGIAHSMQHEGYTTSYMYGGDIDVMGMRGYLVRCGYEQLFSERDFTIAEENESKWGVNDSVSANRVLDIIRTKDATGDKPWLMGYLTLSSHEPFEVPYHRLEDLKLNAFAFTDACVGRLVDSLKTLPLWDNLLVVLMPDHGFLYDLTYEDPEFFHCPMLWLGGAIKGPRTMDVLMNQSDFCATLLSQMGISHSDYPWSRNVLSTTYTQPFVYSTFPSGIMYKDSTGVSVYDITSQKPISECPAPNAMRLRRAKAILQTSYDKLETMR